MAGHVKVADFGLVKDVGKSQASLVGGLTPLYSAPEVFQGSPSTFSDQYSLAVLYQEMLTGVLPFARRDRGRADAAASARRPRPVAAADGATGTSCRARWRKIRRSDSPAAPS